MEFPQYSSIQLLVEKIKKNMFSTVDLYSYVSPSAYDTAWLAMIPDDNQPDGPMFVNCLNWVLSNQKENGFWGEPNCSGKCTIDCLAATLACLVALKKWNVEPDLINNGLAFVNANSEKLLVETCHQFPRWFTVVFPALLELAKEVNLHIVFSNRSKAVVTDLFTERQRILETENLVDMYHYPPLLSYLEALPSSYGRIYQEDIVKHLTADGSLFQSPSATAQAFMATGNKKCLAYLQALAQKCTNGVPSMYPMDEDLIKLCIVNQIQRLGLAEHFVEDMDVILTQVYRNYVTLQSRKTQISLPVQLYKDSLAFRLLRMHHYNVSPWSFCWFLNNGELLAYMEKNYEYFSSTMLNVYRATDLMFSGEYELQEARSFSRKLLEKITSTKTDDDNLIACGNFQKVIEHELNLPWIARLDHLDHRKWIEEEENNALWMGKVSLLRLSSHLHDHLMQLAITNYDFRQSTYKNELEELKRWTKRWGLSDMGFCREKTSYCYFAIAASCCLPWDSDIRMLVAKSAIVITVADDFFDMEGSIDELKSLNNAVQRWNGEGLESHSKTIFAALDDLVKDTAAKHFLQQGSDITRNLQDIWYETFTSWMREAEWSRNGSTPSLEEYLEIGKTSIATHTLVLPASCFLKPSLPNFKLSPPPYETITNLLMVIPRLLNDVQSYEKELEQGKSNYVLLYLKENPEADIKDSIAYVKDMLDNKKKEFIEHVFMDGLNELPKPFKQLHLSCLKVFQMFFNSSNQFDSNEAMLLDIGRAIHFPLEVNRQMPKPLKPSPPLFPSGPKKENLTIKAHINLTSMPNRRTFTLRFASSASSIDCYGCGKIFTAPKFNPCFI